MKVTRSMLGASLDVNITALDKTTFQQGSLNDKDWAVYRIPSV